MEAQKSQAGTELFEGIDVFAKVSEWFWAIFGIVSLIVVLATGAWWHLLTVGVCVSLYLTSRSENLKSNRHER